MEHRPRTYATLPEVLDDMARTMVGEVMRETLQLDSATIPLEVICVNYMVVKLIVSLDYREGTESPFLVRAWDWIGRGSDGRMRPVRGVLQLWVMNAQGEVIYRAVYPPEPMVIE